MTKNDISKHFVSKYVVCNYNFKNSNIASLKPRVQKKTWKKSHIFQT